MEIFEDFQEDVGLTLDTHDLLYEPTISSNLELQLSLSGLHHIYESDFISEVEELQYLEYQTLGETTGIEKDIIGNTDIVNAGALELDNGGNFSTEIITGERWLEYVEEDLNPWWTMETAKGEPLGNFPSALDNDGELIDLSNLSYPFSEMGPEFSWLMDNLDKHFIVPQSRQAFTYGVAYHMTGNPEFLELAKAGVDWLRENGLDRENGGAFSFIEDDDTPGPSSIMQRKSQELAYAAQGMAFYYYLTEDEQVLSDIIDLKDYIFDNYYDPERDLITYLPSTLDIEEVPAQREALVSNLDQMNSYLLLMAPILPEPYQSEWKEDLVNLSHTLIDEFYDPLYNVFWHDIENPEDRNLGALDANFQPNTDYGHSIKSLWMIYHTGQLVEDPSLIAFAETNAALLLEEAYDPESGSWARGALLDENGEIIRNFDKEWWIYAELDQMAGTLSLQDSFYADEYLNSTVNWWFDNMVDHTNGEVWNTLTWPTLEPTLLPKQWQWKNGFHTYEHALVGYITSSGSADEPITLYFARGEGEEIEEIRPYYYDGDITKITFEALPSFSEVNLSSQTQLHKVAVTFENLRADS